MSAAPIPQGDDWLPTIERDEEYAREYIRMAGWEVQTKGKGSTFRICDPKGDRLPIPDSPYLHDTLTRMAHDIFDSWVKQAAALAASEARVMQLREIFDTAAREVDRLAGEKQALLFDVVKQRAWADEQQRLREAAEQSLAEAVALLRDEAALLRAWARESRDGGWSTHQVDPMNRRAAAIDALLPKGEGETS